MGKIDIACHRFFSRNDNFADLCNGYLYNGENIISANNLVTDDSKITNDNKVRYVDIIKKLINQNTTINLIVLENQNKIDYSMPMRNMLNEAMLYNNQLLNCQEQHKKNKDLNINEYLSGISKNDNFIPIIIIVFYLGEKKWDGPRCLHDMLNIDDTIKQYVNNYSLNILDYHDYINFDNFKGEVKNLLSLLGARKNKNKMKDIINNIGCTDYDTAKLLSNILNIKNIENYVNDNETERTVDMCKAWDDHFNDGVKLGKKNGKRLGREEGLKALIATIKPLVPDFESVYAHVIENKIYKNVTKEEVLKYY